MKKKFSQLSRFLMDSNFRFLVLSKYGFLHQMSDENFLKKFYKVKFGHELDLQHPKTYNEKMQWLKLHDRQSIYTTMVDKYAAKQYVGNLLGEEYIIPTLGVWKHVEEIDFNSLPNQFVLKCTHDSHSTVICRDKSVFNISEAKKRLNEKLNENYFYRYREWPYKNVTPHIIAEKYMENCSIQSNNFSKQILNDYKVYTFNGKAKMCMINQARGVRTQADYYDRNYNWLDFTWGFDHAEKKPKRPKNYEQMCALAEKLAVGIPTVRVDFYEVDGKIYFGEMTFYDGSGFDPIKPYEWDMRLGSWLHLPIDEN